MEPRFRADQDGFTIVEIVLALVLLSFVVLGFQAATGEIIHSAARSDRQTVAVQLVENRLDLIQLDPEYEGLEARYSETEAAIPGYTGLTRTTTIDRTEVTQETGVLDYLTITVEVTGTGLPEPVTRTTVVATP